MKKILRAMVIDDEADTLLPILADALEARGYSLSKEADPERALDVLEAVKPDVVLLDLRFPGDDIARDGSTTGGRLLTRIRRRFDELPVMVFTTCLDDADIPLEEFVEQPHSRFAKPDFNEDPNWAESLDRAIRETVAASEFSREPPQEALAFIVGTSKEMAEVVRQARLASQNSLNVLIYGETGTGKQAVAEAIHKLSGRKGEFRQLNCSGVDQGTLEALLFGHERGAYTGANTSRPGLFEAADKGTLFLDEIQRMPLILQEKIKKFVEDGIVQRMGQTSPGRKLDVRLIVATNHSLRDLVDDGYLLEDLAQRFSVLLLSLPPLRKRMNDIPQLFEELLERANTSTGRNVRPVLRPETLTKLQSHGWPGNIRELENTILRAVANSTSNVLTPDDIVFSDIVASAARRQNLKDAAPDGATELDQARDGPSSFAEATVQKAASALTDRLEALPRDRRYRFLVDETDGDLRRRVLIELVRRLRQRQKTKVRHKDLVRELDPSTDREVDPTRAKRDLDRIRKFINDSVRLTDLDFNT